MSAVTLERRKLECSTILFFGDSGDGMQLIGSQFTSTSAMLGNDVCTMPDYPSEIRAPTGTVAGVSAFQVSISGSKIQAPGDQLDALVAMNPAALKVYLPRLAPGGLLVVNSDAFGKANLRKAGYEKNPLDDPDLDDQYQVHAVPMATQTKLSAGVRDAVTTQYWHRCRKCCLNWGFHASLLFSFPASAAPAGLA